MRLTVGPLPPSVYWRRRALVVGLLGLVGTGIVYAVSSRPTSGTGPNLAETSTPTSGVTATATPTPTAFTLPVATVTGLPTTPSMPVTGANCADSEILLTAQSSSENLGIGEPATFTLRIKNISPRTCNRNIGSIPQELRLRRAGVVVWSSDDCATGTPYDYEQSFTPGLEKVFTVAWDGFRSRDDSGAKTCARPGVKLAGGAYELVARLGTLYSTPVTLTVRSGS